MQPRLRDWHTWERTAISPNIVFLSKILDSPRMRQCLRVIPNKYGILKDDEFIESFRCNLGLRSHIPDHFADEHHFIGHDDIMQDWSTHR